MDFQSLTESQNTRCREGQNTMRREGSPKSLAECPAEIAPISTYAGPEQYDAQRDRHRNHAHSVQNVDFKKPSGMTKIHLLELWIEYL